MSAADWVLVAEPSLVRLSGRMASVLSDAATVRELTFEQFRSERPALAETTQALLLGRGVVDRFGGPERVRVDRQQEGIVWGRLGRAVALWVEPEGDLLQRGLASEKRMDRLTHEAARGREAAEARGAANSSGARMAHRFLRREHGADPRETLRIDDGVHFGLERMVWERENVCAVAAFLLDGYPRYQLERLRASNRPLLERAKRPDQ